MPVLSTVGAASLRAFGAFRQGTAAGFISATGGTITTSGNYKYHTFTSSGTFSVASVPSVGRLTTFSLLVAVGLQIKRAAAVAVWSLGQLKRLPLGLTP